MNYKQTIEKLRKNSISQEEKDYLLGQPAVHSHYNALPCGYYKVKDTTEDASEPMLIVIFNESLDNIEQGKEFRIRKNPLFNKSSVHPENSKITIGCIIHIQSIELEDYIWNNIKKQRYKITWEIV